MFTYLKMKKAEWKVKLSFYGTIASIIDNQKPIITMIQTLFEELKNVPPEELKSEFINKIAELAHEQAVKERENEANIQI